MPRLIHFLQPSRFGVELRSLKGSLGSRDLPKEPHRGGELSTGSTQPD